MDRLIDQAIAFAEQERRQQLSEDEQHLHYHPREDASVGQGGGPAGGGGGDPGVGDDDHDDHNGQEMLPSVRDGEFDESDSTLRMAITTEERQWALSIKEVVDFSPGLSWPPISDMMIAQIAIVSIAAGEGDNVEKMINRIRDLQNIRSEYKVVESLESGKAILRHFVNHLLPGFILSFHYNPVEECDVLVLDLTKFDMSILPDPRKARIWLQGFYYIYHCQNPDLEATRNGIMCLFECQGYHRKGEHMFQLRAFQDWAVLASGYPLHAKSFMHYHTGLFVNLMTSMGKKFLPYQIAEKFSFGHVSKRGRLDRIYLPPSLKAANRKHLRRLERALELRHTNEASFHL